MEAISVVPFTNLTVNLLFSSCIPVTIAYTENASELNSALLPFMLAPTTDALPLSSTWTTDASLAFAISLVVSDTLIGTSGSISWPSYENVISTAITFSTV